MDVKKIVYKKLEELGIKYEVMEHEPAFTIEDIDRLHISDNGLVCKNLFLRDEKGRRHFLLILNGHKEVDLKEIRKCIGSTRLSFGSAERLDRCLKLTQGSVSPFGVINDTEGLVEVVIDSELKGKDKIGFHPNENTATVWVDFEGLIKFINANGNDVIFVDI